MPRSLVPLAAVLFVSSTADAAPSRAWTAARKVHAEAPIIVGFDMKSVKGSDSFKKLFPMLLDKKPSAKEVLDRLQATCQLDPLTAVKSLVAVVDDENDDRGGFYVALAGWNPAKVGACMQKVAAADNKKLVVGPVQKGIQQFEMEGKSEKMFLGWIGTDVVVVARDPSNRAMLASMLTGKGKGEANKLASKLDTGASMWMSVIKAQPIQGSIAMKALYGTIKLAKGTAAADLRVVTGDATQASDLVTMFNTEIPKIQGMLPPAAKALVQSLVLTNAGAEVKATASAPEKDILDLLSLAL